MNQKKIIIADDSEDILDSMKMFLELKQFNVRTTMDSENLIPELISFDPDLLILDVYLSGFDGRELCRSIKQNKETQHIKIILFSAARQALENFEEYGANDCLEKPFGLSEVLGKIDTLLSESTVNVNNP